MCITNGHFFQVTAWVDLFTSLSGQLDGYGKNDVLPYVHAMVYHVPHFMKVQKGIKKFTVQGKPISNNFEHI